MLAYNEITCSRHMLSTTLPTLTIPIRQRLIESLCETEHTIHIRYARHCGGGGRDHSNGDDSMM